MYISRNWNSLFKYSNFHIQFYKTMSTNDKNGIKQRKKKNCVKN